MRQHLGFYRFEYENGMIQTKELLSNQDYAYFSQLSSEKNVLEIEIKVTKNKKGKLIKTPEEIENLKKSLKDVKTKLKDFPYPYFVVGSPMFKAIKTGVIDIIDIDSGNFGQTKVKITKVESAQSTDDTEEID